MEDLKPRLEAHVRQVAHPRDPDWSPLGYCQVKQYVQEQLSRWGSLEEFRFEYCRRTYGNWILKLPGSSPRRDPILVGAHFDAVPASPGADDNASGVAVLLELARYFAQDPSRSPLWLVAFDLEERGLVGSTAYAQFLKQQGQPLRLMLSLEMLGYRDPTAGSQRYPTGLERFYPDRGDYIGLIGNWPTLPDLLRLQQSLKKAGIPCQWLPAGQRGWIVPSTRRSDHAPFWDEGYRAVLVTDTADLRNPHYHKLSDSPETLDLDFLAGVCRGLMAGLRHL
ncbi:M28 family peptidase [Thermostichus vulcanus]|uniref:M28 family peptidase n=1 Tax=Thermostichus vulcanus str. 'Rupite' TaxID=2813851 RepID=A0ABT0CF00_THEVL|nr:M28 family peptidase [Thermostichus vulcanus]MCJ2544359.1 M28 family peptidase [Thermostichus vulcanus str. 'Rupite']